MISFRCWIFFERIHIYIIYEKIETASKVFKKFSSSKIESKKYKNWGRKNVLTQSFKNFLMQICYTQAEENVHRFNFLERVLETLSTISILKSEWNRKISVQLFLRALDTSYEGIRRFIILQLFEMLHDLQNWWLL